LYFFWQTLGDIWKETRGSTHEDNCLEQAIKVTNYQKTDGTKPSLTNDQKIDRELEIDRYI